MVQLECQLRIYEPIKVRPYITTGEGHDVRGCTVRPVAFGDQASGVSGDEVGSKSRLIRIRGKSRGMHRQKPPFGLGASAHLMRSRPRRVGFGGNAALGGRGYTTPVIFRTSCHLIRPKWRTLDGLKGCIAALPRYVSDIPSSFRAIPDSRTAHTDQRGSLEA